MYMYKTPKVLINHSRRIIMHTAAAVLNCHVMCLLVKYFYARKIATIVFTHTCTVHVIINFNFFLKQNNVISEIML